VSSRQPAVLTAWFLLGLASIVVPLGCGDEADPDATGRIAFTVNRDGFGEIWVMDPDGRDRARLTDAGSPGVDTSGSTSPAWSPDGREIAFASSGDAVGEDQGDVEIYVMSAGGGEKRRLTRDDVHDAAPAWSPDGRRLAFAHTPALGTEDADGVIVVMNGDGAGRFELTQHPRTPEIILDSHPAWSPDGSLIAFTRATFTSGSEPQVAIYTIARRPAAASVSWSTTPTNPPGRPTEVGSPSRASAIDTGRHASRNAAPTARSTRPVRTAQTFGG
jgi:Tol biopolymer transport system component